MSIKYTSLKYQSLEACASLSHIQSEHHHRLRQLRCGQFIHYAIKPGSLEMHINRANWCGLKTCPICTSVRTAKLRGRLFQGLPRLLADYPTAIFLFLTLTVKNCHFGQLRACVRTMEQGWKRLTNTNIFSATAIGFLKSLEVTRPRDYYYRGCFVGRYAGYKADRCFEYFQQQPDWDYSRWRSHACEEVHPHFHVLLMVPSSYFTPDNYLNQQDWQNLWRRSARLDYDPIVDIRAVKKLNNGILEISKYTVKPTDMTDVYGCLTIRQLHGLRRTAIGGVFSDYFSQKAVDAIAQTGRAGTEHWQNGVPCWYEWDGEKYSLTRLANLEWEIA